jgi:hypothetical protein
MHELGSGQGCNPRARPRHPTCMAAHPSSSSIILPLSAMAGGFGLNAVPAPCFRCYLHKNCLKEEYEPGHDLPLPAQLERNQQPSTPLTMTAKMLGAW